MMYSSVLTVAVRFRLLLLGLAAGLVVAGVLSVREMPADVLPELQTAPQLEVQTEALGLSSQEVEQYVTVPLENNLLDGIMGVWDVRSRSVAGLSTIDLLFEPGTTELHARQLVEERLTNAFSLPNVAQPPQLIQPLSSSARVMLIGLRSRSLDPLELSYLARWVIKPRLSGIPGVANVAIFGQRDRQIQVLVDPAQLAAHGVTLDNVIRTAGNAQLVSPLSYLEGSSPGTGGFLDGANQRLDIRPVLPLGAPRNLAAVPIAGSTPGLHLGDVSHVVEGHQPLIGNALVGGGSGFVLEVQKLPGASVLGVSTGIDHALAELRPALGGVQIDTSLFRPASYVSSSVSTIELAVLIAAALGILALGAVLLDARSLAVAALCTGLSLLAALVLLHLLGEGINAMVILGLLIASAVVVDDGVASAHTILTRVRGRGTGSAAESLRSVVIAACAELRSSLAYATLISLATVVPLLVATGPTATFIRPMAIAFAVSLVASMLVAITLAPALGVVLFEPRGPQPPPPVALRLRRGYERLLRRSLLLPIDLLAGVCLLGAAALIVMPFINGPAAPRFRDRNLIVSWSGPDGASLGEMDRVTNRVLARLRALPSVADDAATLGRAITGDRITDPSDGELDVRVRRNADYDQAMSQIRSIVQGVPGFQASVGTYEDQVTAGLLTANPDQLQVRVYGENFGVLRGLVDRVEQTMAQVGGLGQPQVQLPTQEPNIEVSVNDTAALRAGVLPGDARRQASTLVSGLTVGNFFQSQAVFDVVVRGQPQVRASAGAVRNLLIDTASGHVRLGQIANVAIRPDPVDIQHEALSRYVEITAPVQSRSAADISSDLNTQLAALRMPLGYHAEVVAGTPAAATSHVALVTYALAAAVAILLLLQAMLQSWRLAALLFLALPFSLSGGLLIALLTGQARSLAADAALLAVYGFATRQATLLVAHVRRQQALDGGPLTPATLVAAAGERLVPAVGGALVIVAVLLPFALLGSAPGNELTHVAADVIIGGLCTSVLLTVVLLPALLLRLGPTEPITGAEPWEDMLHVPPLEVDTPSGR